MPARDFPFMQVKNSAFSKMAGLGAEFGNHLLRLERAEPLAVSPGASLFVLQHHKIMTALQSFSDNIHPWYPILKRTSQVVSQLVCLIHSSEVPIRFSFL